MSRSAYLAALILVAGAAVGQPLPENHPARGTVDLAFSPWDDAEALLLKTLAAAKREIYVQAFILTSATIAQGLIDAHRRGLRVEVLLDQQQVLGSELSQAGRLAQAGIPVALETRYSAAHNKVMVIDPGEDCAVITGSYNYSQSAKTRNAENLLVLKGDPVLAGAYLSNWQRHRADAVPYTQATHLLAGQGSRTKAKVKSVLRFPWEGSRSGLDWLR